MESEKGILRIRATVEALGASDPASRAEAAQALEDELADFDLRIEHPADEAPDRAKAGVPFAPGEIVLALLASGGVLTSLIGLLQNWLSRRERHSIVLEIDGDRLEIHGLESADQQRLIDSWIERHTEAVKP